VTRGDVGLGAATGAISAAVAFGVGWLNTVVLNGLLSDFSVSVIGGSIGGGVGAELRGRDFWEGAAYGAVTAAAAYTLIQLPSAVKALATKWEMVEGMTGTLKLPRAIGKLVAQSNTTGKEHDYDAGHGMHGWHASSNARVAAKIGPLFAPIQWLGGLAHEVYDFRSIRWEIEAQGVAGWFVDSLGDITANTFGMATGYLVSPASAGSVGRQIGYMVPGLLDKDPDQKGAQNGGH
jgi:hypothetical protein